MPSVLLSERVLLAVLLEGYSRLACFVAGSSLNRVKGREKKGTREKGEREGFRVGNDYSQGSSEGNARVHGLSRKHLQWDLNHPHRESGRPLLYYV